MKSLVSWAEGLMSLTSAFRLQEVSCAVGAGHSEGVCLWLCPGWFSEGARTVKFDQTLNQMLKATISCWVA